MKKILISASIVVAVAAVVVGATTAFFSDTETSTGNTFTAGAIDLTVDNQSYVTGPDGHLIASPNTSWTLSDITGQLFFNFSDLKPGDIGEDTISLHVDSNDAYLCAAARVPRMTM
jgi:predicted ribosomally synthesized peptide with SipW-like signal peptide